MPPPKKAVAEMEQYTAPTEGRRGKLRLDFNENTLGCSQKVVDALRKVTADDVSVYPAYGEFLGELARYLDVDASEVLLTNGSDEGIKAVMDAYIEQGDEVVLPVPTFAMFKAYASIAGAKINEIKYNSDLSFPLKQLLAAISGKTKLVILVNPNNPTGTAINECDIVRILKKAKDSIVLIDEAYWQYFGKSCKGLIKKYDNLIVLQTFSKAFGLAGLRLGYAISNQGTISLLQKVISPYSVNSLALIAGKAALQDLDFVNSYVAEVKESKAYVERELQRLGIKTYPSKANFVLANFGNKCVLVCRKLKAKKILVRSRANYPLSEGCVRVGIGTRQQSFRLVQELKAILRRNVILFDLDGVLVDVSNSYRLAIKKTAEFFTKQTARLQDIQSLKERRGYNNDWDLTLALIAAKGFKIRRKDVIRKFQEFYLGCNGQNGFIGNEKWMLSPKILSELYKKYRLGIVTGRPKKEAYTVLKKFNMLDFFDCVVTMADYKEKLAKPNPFSINLALKQLGSRQAVYVGDSVDDIKAARNAKIESIGVLPPYVSSDSLKQLLTENGAKTVLNDVNKLGRVLK